MSFIKLGSSWKITKTAGSATELLIERPSQEQKVIENKNDEFLYFVAKGIAAGDEGPIGKDGKREWNPNGNFDFFPRKEIESAMHTWIGKGLYLDHNASSVLYSVGKIIDVYPTVDPENGEWSVSCLCKMDRKLHPELARKVLTGELNTVSMGCSCDESKCSVCGKVLHSDADEKCAHLEGFGLGKKYQAEVDLPEYGIKKGEVVPAFSINSGLSFNELSLVGVPAWPRAFVTTILSNMQNNLSKKGSLSKNERLDLVAQVEKLFEKLDESERIELKAEFNSLLSPSSSSKELDMSDKNTIVMTEDTKKVLAKISALEMEQLESYVQHKTKKANESVNKPIIDEAAKKEETFFKKIISKVKGSFAAELLEKKIEAIAKEEMGKESSHKHTCQECGDAWECHKGSACIERKTALCGKHYAKREFGSKSANKSSKCIKCDKSFPVEKMVGNEYGAGYLCKEDAKEWNADEPTKKATLSVKFTEDKTNVLASTWSLYDGDKLILDASLNDIWGAEFAKMSFDNQRWATSTSYGKEIIATYKKVGLSKLADLWDVSHKISKVAEEHKVTCPDCGSDIWDVAKGHKLNKCWNCGLAFDNESVSEDKDASLKTADASLSDEQEIRFERAVDRLDKKLMKGEIHQEEYDAEYAKLKKEMFPKESSLKVADKGELFKAKNFAKPNTGTDNKKHNIKDTPVGKPEGGKLTPGKGSSNDWSDKDVKTETKLDMPGQTPAQKGPSAPAPMKVKTDYSEPKPEAVGKEVKTTPKNPDEKDVKKSEKEVETGYVAVGEEAKEAEEGKVEKKASFMLTPVTDVKTADEARQIAIDWQHGQSEQNLSYGELLEYDSYFTELANKFGLSDEFAENGIIGKVEKGSEIVPCMECGKPHKIEWDGYEAEPMASSVCDECKNAPPEKKSFKEQNSLIKWSSMSSEAQDFIKKHVEKHIKEDGMERAQAVAAAYAEARKKGFAVSDSSKKSSQETIMQKEATDKPVESVESSTIPDGKKTMGDKSEESVQGDTQPNGAAPASEPEMSVEHGEGKKTTDLTKKPEESVEGTTLPKGSVPNSEADEAVNKSAATKMPVPEMKEEVIDIEKPSGTPDIDPTAPVDGVSVDAPIEEVSAFDKAETIDVGDGYSARKDKDTQEIVIEKDGGEIKRLPDGFGKEVGEVLKLLKAVLGLPSVEESASEVADISPASPEVVEDRMEEESAPAPLDEAHEDEFAAKESALKLREEAILKKEAEIKAVEAQKIANDKAQKFAAMLQIRSEKCKKIIESMINKEALSYDVEAYEEALLNDTPLLEAREKAFQVSINAKMKQLLAMSDEGIVAVEKTINELPVPSHVNSKKASWLRVSPEFGAQLSEEQEIAKIFNTMGNSKLRPE